MSNPPPQKDGLDSALEFTKFVITLDSGLIAFLTGAAFLASINEQWETVSVIVSLAFLVASVIAGVFVYMRVATMLSDAKYDLGDPWLSIPGAINVACFAFGAAGVAALAVIELVLTPPKTEKAAPQPICLVVTVESGGTPVTASPAPVPCRL
jgi:vacuolar-type H+-ATPase subunit I/STV1